MKVMTRSASVVVVMNGFQTDYETDFVNALALNGVHVELIASDLTRVDRLVGGVNAINLRGSQAPERGWVNKSLNILRYQRDLLSYLRARKPMPVHLGGWFSTRNSILGIVEALLLRSLARPFVFTVHNVLPHDRRTRWQAVVHWVIYRIPHRLVVHTNRMREELIQRYRVPARKITVMEHGIGDVVPFDEALRRDVRAKWKMAPGQRLLLLFGNVGKYKGADLFVDAVAHLDGTFVGLIAGRGDPKLEATLSAQIADSTAHTRIHRINRYLEDAEVAGLFHAADAVVMPYRAIDQSGVLFQALRFGVPVLAFDVGALGDYVTSAVGRVTSDHTARGLSDMISQFFRTGGMRDAQGIHKEAERYLWTETVRTVIPLYQE